MDGIAAIADRMAQIQSFVGGLSATGGAAGTLGSSGTTSTTTSASSSASTFASALADASGTGSSGIVWSSTVTRLGGGKVPAVLAEYGNGKIPTSALAEVGDTGHHLWGPAASQLTDLIAAAKADGVTIGITDSYRSYAAQVDVAARKGLYSQGGLAAVPGTSDHGWGMAVDLDLDSSALAWMREHGAEYGFVGDVPRESWHWSYQPS